MDKKSGSGRLDSPTSPAPATTPNGSVVPDSYKTLPDDDVNWQSKNNKTVPGEDLKLKDMGKQNGTDGGDDEAQERMLADNVKLSVVPSKEKDASEVKFIPENGDAKIDIETVKISLSGMGKAELMKYANDPFWIKLRWFLFIAFWVLWIAMLVGAVTIIVMAPKCTAPEPKKWFEKSPIVKLSSADLKNYLRDPSGLETRLKFLQELKIKGIVLPSILKENLPGHVENFRLLNSDIKSVKDFKKFVKAAKDKEINVIMDIDPNHSSNQHIWFNKSTQGEESYKSYYIWADGTKDADRGPPNNWLSVHNGSAWEYNNDRKKYYLHQFNKTQPDLNFTNPAVIKEFLEIFKYWLDLGVRGFRLGSVRHLVEDSSLKNDSRNQLQHAEQGSYDSLFHDNTRDLKESFEVLRKWREFVLNYTNDEGLFTVGDELNPQLLDVYNSRKLTLIDIPNSIYNKDLQDIKSTTEAVQLNKTISHILEGYWPLIDLSGIQSNLRNQLDPKEADSLILMTMLLPATPVFELNDLKIENTEFKSAFSLLSDARDKEPFWNGKTETHVLNNGTVFVYVRIKSGNPGYLVAYNSGQESTTVDLQQLPYVSEEVTVVTHSPNYGDKLIQSQKLLSNKVPLNSKSTLVVTFVAKT